MKSLEKVLLSALKKVGIEIHVTDVCIKTKSNKNVYKRIIVDCFLSANINIVNTNGDRERVQSTTVEITIDSTTASKIADTIEEHIMKTLKQVKRKNK